MANIFDVAKYILEQRGHIGLLLADLILYNHMKTEVIYQCHILYL